VSQFKAYCSYDCLKEYTVKNRETLAEKVRKEKRQLDRIKRDKLKTKGHWTKEAQAAFNAYVRERDKHEGCISCGLRTADNSTGGDWDCGHYRSTGSAPHLRFHLWNAHKQCKKCNRYLSGNVAQYRVALIWKLGHEKVEALEKMNDAKHYSVDDLKRIKKIFTKKKQRLTKAS
jgi:hypothetical protein